MHIGTKRARQPSSSCVPSGQYCCVVVVVVVCVVEVRVVTVCVVAVVVEVTVVVVVVTLVWVVVVVVCVVIVDVHRRHRAGHTTRTIPYHSSVGSVQVFSVNKMHWSSSCRFPGQIKGASVVVVVGAMLRWSSQEPHNTGHPPRVMLNINGESAVARRHCSTPTTRHATGSSLPPQVAALTVASSEISNSGASALRIAPTMMRQYCPSARGEAEGAWYGRTCVVQKGKE